MNYKELTQGDVFKNKPHDKYILYAYLQNLKDYSSELGAIRTNPSGLYGALFSLKLFIEEALNTKYELIESNIIKDKSSFSHSLSNQIYVYIINFFMNNSLIHELNVAEEHLISPLKSNPKIEFVIEITNNCDWIEYYFEKYPVLYFIVSNFIENQFSYIDCIINNTIKDINILKKIFNITRPITSIEILKGDMHNINKSTTLVQFDDKKILYKPRLLDIEEIVTALIQKFDINYFGVPKSLSLINYGYQEYIPNENSTKRTKYKTSKYFKQSGKIAAFLQSLNIEDISYDNIIYNNIPYIIDLECSFQSKIKKINDVSEIHFTNTVISTCYINTTFGLKEYNKSPLYPSNDGRKKIPHTLKGLVSDNNISNFVKLNNSDKHLPPFYLRAQSDLDIEYYNNEFLKGLKKFTKKSNLNALKEIIQNLKHQIIKSTPRIILKDTQVYADILFNSRQPINLSSAKNYTTSISLSLDNTDNDSEIIDSELRQLINGDIPLFKIRNLDLIDASNNLVKSDFFSVLNYTTVINKIELLKKNKNVYYKIVEEVLENSNSDLFLYNKYFILFKELSITKEKSKIETEIINFLSTKKIKTKDATFWLNIYFNDSKFILYGEYAMYLTTIDHSLFSGIGGIALVYGLYNNIENDLTINQIQAHLLQIYLSNTTRKEHSLFSNEIALIIINSLLKEQKTNSKLTESLFESILDNLEKEIEITSDRLSIINGLTGTYMFLFNNKNLLNSENEIRLHKLVNNYFEEVIVYQKKVKSEYWQLSNGVLSTIALYELTKEYITLAKVHKFYKEVKNNLASFVYSKKEEKSLIIPSWSNGVLGIISILIIIDERKFDNFLFEKYHEFIKNHSNTNYSISSGISGQIIVMQELSLYLKRYNSEIKDFNQYINELEFKDFFKFDKNSDGAFKLFLQKGLFNGISGFVYTLNKINSNTNFNIIIPNRNWLNIAELNSRSTNINSI